MLLNLGRGPVLGTKLNKPNMNRTQQMHFELQMSFKQLNITAYAEKIS